MTHAGVTASEAELGQAEYLALARILHDEARIALGDAKATLVRSRLARRLRATGIDRFADYVHRVREDPVERTAMVTALTTNHTHFFRENHHFDHLVAEVRPILKERSASRPVRLWSAGCSSGEEVYSLAMALAGDSRSGAGWLLERDVKLLATDISLPVVEATARARYTPEACAPIPPRLRGLWTRNEGSEVAILPELSGRVHAKALNLFGEWPIRHRFDVIFCRNVMIYFDDSGKRELELRLVAQLNPGGHLYIGHSERLLGEATQAMTACGHTIYRKAGELP